LPIFLTLFLNNSAAYELTNFRLKLTFFKEIFLSPQT
jgi:hypothetical protein